MAARERTADRLREAGSGARRNCVGRAWLGETEAPFARDSIHRSRDRKDEGREAGARSQLAAGPRDAVLVVDYCFFRDANALTASGRSNRSFGSLTLYAMFLNRMTMF